MCVVKWPLTKMCCVVCSYAETPSYGDYSTVESQVVELKVRLRAKKLDLAAIRGKVRERGGEGEIIVCEYNVTLAAAEAVKTAVADFNPVSVCLCSCPCMSGSMSQQPSQTRSPQTVSTRPMGEVGGREPPH